MIDALERTPIAQAPLSVILPAYNQETNLEKALGDWIDYVESLGRDYEVFVVDDGSTDRTAELAEAQGAAHPRLRVLRHPSHLGYGAALRTGLASAQYPLCFYADCNNGYVAGDLQLLLEAVDQVDVVAGHRIWAGPQPRVPFKERVFRGLVRPIFGVKLKDIDCAFKLFRREIFRRIPIQCNSSFVHTEILAKANFLGCLMTEVPVSYHPPAELHSETLNRMGRWADAYQILRDPDFGPAVLPEVGTEPTPNVM